MFFFPQPLHHATPCSAGVPAVPEETPGSRPACQVLQPFTSSLQHIDFLSQQSAMVTHCSLVYTASHNARDCYHGLVRNMVGPHKPDKGKEGVFL